MLTQHFIQSTDMLEATVTLCCDICGKTVTEEITSKGCKYESVWAVPYDSYFPGRLRIAPNPLWISALESWINRKEEDDEEDSFDFITLKKAVKRDERKYLLHCPECWNTRVLKEYERYETFRAESKQTNSPCVRGSMKVKVRRRKKDNALFLLLGGLGIYPTGATKGEGFGSDPCGFLNGYKRVDMETIKILSEQLQEVVKKLEEVKSTQP